VSNPVDRLSISTAQEVLITTVHGTWGRLAPPWSAPLWFEENSGFAENLKRDMNLKGANATISPFIWSGANSLAHRANAGAKLARQIVRQNRKHPEALQVIVGHSHGGSVCMLGLHGLPPAVKPLVITLATPFVELVRAEPTGSAAFVKRVVVGGFFGPTVIGLLISLFLLLKIDNFLGIVLSILVQCLSLLPHLYGVAKADPDTVGMPETAWLRDEPRRPEIYQSLTVGGATIDSPRKVLVLRGVDDEAGLILAVGSVGTRLSSLALVLSMRLAQVLMYVMVLALVVVVAAGIWEEFQPAKEFIRSVLENPFYATPIIGMVCLFFAIPIISGLFKSVYGRELIVGDTFAT
jgi:hypothetical protein